MGETDPAGRNERKIELNRLRSVIKESAERSMDDQIIVRGGGGEGGEHYLNGLAVKAPNEP